MYKQLYVYILYYNLSSMKWNINSQDLITVGSWKLSLLVAEKKKKEKGKKERKKKKKERKEKKNTRKYST